jgi:DNA primase large subunit
MSILKQNLSPVKNEYFSRHFLYKTHLFYKNCPDCEISLEEFESYALNRVQFLNEICELSGRLNEDNGSCEIVKIFHSYFDDVNSLKTREDYKQNHAHMCDNLSHWICRLIFCCPSDCCNWFIDQETCLFRAKMEEGSVNLIECLKEFNIHSCIVNEEELVEHGRSIMDTLYSHLPKEKISDFFTVHDGILILKKIYFTVPFENVPDLVRERKAFIYKGLAFVPEDYLISLSIAKYRDSLIQALDKMSYRWEKFLRESEHLIPLINKIKANCRINNSKESEKSSFDVELVMLDKIKAQDVEAHLMLFPLCMQHLYTTLKVKRHLKFMGRQQLGLFLKGIGLKIDESLLFWRNMFNPKISKTVFEKEYAYNIRHNYGNVGKQKDYSPYNCANLLTHSPKTNDCHGCPFKTLDSSSLIKKLNNLGICESDSKTIVKNSEIGNYQIACAQVFESLFEKKPESAIITHPNIYYIEAKIVQIKQKEKLENKNYL